MNANTRSLFALANLRGPRLLLVGAILLGLGVLSSAAERPLLADAPKGHLTSRPRAATPPEKPLTVGADINTTASQRRRVMLPDGSLLFVNVGSKGKLEEQRRLILSEGEVFVEAATPPKGVDTPFVIQTPAGDRSGTAAHFGVRVTDKGDEVTVTRGQVRVGGRDLLVTAGQRLAPGSVEPEPLPRASYVLDWLKDLVAAADSPLVPKSQHAGGALVAIDPSGQETKLSLRKYHVDVHIEDGFARTTIDQTYFNHESAQLEGTFYFPLPPDASLSRLAMYVADGSECKLMEGGMAERDYARQVYETIRYARRDPALLEWVDGSTFKMRVFPLEGRQEKRIILSYTQRLPSLYGQTEYRFPAGHSLQVVDKWSFRAQVKHGADLTWNSPSHTLKARQEAGDLVLDGSAKKAKIDQDVVVHLTDAGKEARAEEVARFSAADHDGARYLMLRYRPKLEGKSSWQRRDWVFLFEASGDRDPLLARTQIDVIRGLLEHVDVKDTFTILTAGTRVKAFAKEPLPVTPENVKAAIEFLEGVHLIGALDLGSALAESGKVCKELKSPYLVHVGSGVAAMGERREDVLAKRIPEGTKYVGVGIGRRWARGFMKAAAERTGGHFTQINPDETVSWRAFELFATLNTPRLMDVQVTDSAGKAKFLAFTQMVAQGEEVCAVTRLGPGAKVDEVTIRGTLEGKPLGRKLAVRDIAGQADYLPRTWAKLEIDRLLALDAVKHKDKIVELSKAMYVMTPFTSLLVLENEDMYTQFKVDRGRKDHWAMYAAPDKIPLVYEPEAGQPDPKTARAGRKPAKQVLDTIVIRQLLRYFRDSKGSDPTNPMQDSLIAANGLVRRPADGTLIIARGGSDKESYSQFVNGLTPAGSLTPELNIPIRTSAFDGPPMGGFAGVDGNLAVFGRPARGDLKAERGSTELGVELALQSQLRKSNVFYRLGDGDRVGNVKIVGDLVLGEPSQPLVPQAAAGSTFTFSSPPLGFGTRLDPAKGFFIATEGLYWGNARSDLGLVGSIVLEERLELTNGEMAFAYLPSRPRSRASLLYNRPGFNHEDRIFFDLIAYAPGMNTSRTDIEAVLEAEALPNPYTRPGKIDGGARRLIEKASDFGWQALTLTEEAGRPGLTIHFDGTGRYAWERVLPLGLKERVVCDGKTLTHLYPQLTVGARRAVSRFHRADFADVVPWALPPADDLARGADLKLVGDRTVAIVPHGVDSLKDKDGKQIDYLQVHLVFGDDGRLAERQVLSMPKAEMLLRMTCGDGAVVLFDSKGKELARRAGKLTPAEAPNLQADTKGLVVLPLPYRTPEHVRRAAKIENKGNAQLTFAEALPWFAAEFARGNASGAHSIFREVYHNREQRQLGYYVLLAAAGHNLDAQNADVLAEHLDDPLAQYLALHSSPVLRKHSAQWAAGSNPWGEGFLQHLGSTHAIFQRWQSDKVRKGDAARVKTEEQRALDYVRRNKDSAFGWAMLCLMQDRADDNQRLHETLAEFWPLYAEAPGLGYAARYEEARSLWQGKQNEAARRKFQDLYEKTFAKGLLPAIDYSFRQALLGGGEDADRWNELVRKTAARLIEDKKRPALFALAWQCWQLNDAPLANHLVAVAYEGVTDPKEQVPLLLAAVGFFQETAQLPQADRLLQKLLDDPKLAERAGLWRLASQLAEKRDMPARALECLEKALEIESRNLPEVIDLQKVRTDYGKVLTHYETLADSMVTLKLPPPAGFLGKVVGAADRWRAVEQEAAPPCQTAARILQRLGERELGWDYLTTPVGLRPNEAGPWVGLAETLTRRGDLELAERAYKAASEAEPTNAQILWDRAVNLRQAGKTLEAQAIFRQIADGTWQPRFQGLQSQARAQLGGQ
jgi:tetratricopeptide (TPR) repeat protein